MKGEIFMSTSTVYLAGKMSGLTQEEMTAWRIQAANELQKHGFKIMDPTTQSFNFDQFTSREVVDSNKFQIRNSDIVLAELNHENVSIGTIGELVFAREIGKPVIVWGTATGVIEHPWVDEHSTKIFYELSAAIKYIIDNYRR